MRIPQSFSSLALSVRWQRALRRAGYGLLLMSVLLGASTWGALERSTALRYWLYKEINYQFLADRLCRDARSDEEKITRVASYLHQNLAAVGTQVHDEDVWSDLVRGTAWCDQQVWALSTLLATQNLAARLAMLRAADSSSNHTVAEVQTSQGWSVCDVYTDSVFPLRSSLTAPMRWATMNELQQRPDLLQQHPNWRALPPQAQSEWRKLCDGMLERPEKTVRWTPIRDTVAQSFARRNASAVIRFLVRIGGTTLVWRYQDFVLARQAPQPKPAQTLLHTARQYHLLERFDLARRNYQAVRAQFPNTDTARDALFFEARLLQQSKQNRRAMALWKQLLPQAGQWRAIVLHELSTAHARLGENEAAERYRALLWRHRPILEIVNVATGTK